MLCKSDKPIIIIITQGSVLPTQGNRARALGWRNNPEHAGNPQTNLLFILWHASSPALPGQSGARGMDSSMPQVEWSKLLVIKRKRVDVERT